MKREVALCVIAGDFRGDLSDFKPGGRVTVHKSKHYKSGMRIFFILILRLCPVGLCVYSDSKDPVIAVPPGIKKSQGL